MPDETGERVAFYIGVLGHIATFNPHERPCLHGAFYQGVATVIAAT